ncbi:DUF308 domain-containing protein [Pseudooceanicola sp. CBS1P-1]|uniref:HdeD family acid-resistance protein n=1 Tax=Pseudooceanicola albus TaxID=2692189 RepID=A0A6L7G8S5_9RHOB|nr:MULTISPECIES: DUF308 domain-containing protein [Pseudooceanicola]MBT9386352.1 DUF308 domain-containing protein [Pseudooceanicola endophyticus]MXN20491.1 hypothetical protein [Pseudooceanicola albus]
MKLSTAMIAVSVLLALGGVLALISPLLATLAATSVVGVFFLFAGALQAWVLFQNRFEDVAAALMALLCIVAGVWVLADPLRGATSLGMILGALFFVMGAVRVLMALQVKGSRARWLLMLSGTVTGLMGVLTIFDVGGLASQLLGILLGFTLLFEGAGLFAFGMALNRRGY